MKLQEFLLETIEKLKQLEGDERSSFWVEKRFEFHFLFMADSKNWKKSLIFPSIGIDFFEQMLTWISNEETLNPPNELSSNESKMLYDFVEKNKIIFQ